MTSAGLIAAAGLSTRMGRPKAMLPVGGSSVPFVLQLATVFVEAGLAPLIITVPEGELGALVTSVLRPLAAHADSTILCVPNDFPQSGLSGSVLTALAHVGDAAGLVFTPVDAPHASVSLLNALVQGLLTTTAAAVVPVVAARWGHPVAFRHTAWRRLASCAHQGGPRTVLDEYADAGQLHQLSWPDPRVLDDINSVADWERVFGLALPG